MARYIDWYLAELERRLARQVPRERLHQLLTEVETHLSERTEDLQREGMEPRASELAAIDAFGPPERLAALELESRRATVLGTPIAWVLSLTSGVLFFGMSATLVALWSGSSLADTPLVFLLPLPLLAACWIAGRGAVRPIVAAAVAGWLFLVLTSGFVVRWTPDGTWWSRGELLRSASTLRESAESSQSMAKWLRDGRRDFLAASTELEGPKRFRVGSPEAVGLEDAWRDPNLPFFGRGKAPKNLQPGSWVFPSGMELWAWRRGGGLPVVVESTEQKGQMLAYALTVRIVPRLASTPKFAEARRRWLTQSAELEERALRTTRELMREAERREAAADGWLRAHPALWATAAALYAVVAVVAALLAELLGRVATALRTRRSLGWA